MPEYLTAEEEELQRLKDEAESLEGGGEEEPPEPEADEPTVPGGTPAGGPPPTQPGTVPSGAGTPVPQPPPPPPELSGELIGDVGRFFKEWMDNPNRYLSDLATKTREAGEARLATKQQEGTRAIEEWAQGRGLIGSSYEGDLTRERGRDIETERQEQERDLLEMLATAEGIDRSRVGALGLEALKTGDTLGLEKYKAQLEAEQLEEAKRQFGGTLDISQQHIDLRAKELQEEAALSGRSLDLQAARDAASRELELERIGVSREELDLRAEQIRGDAEREGRQIDLQEARDQAAKELSYAQMEHQIKLQTNEMAQRESEFARKLGLDERQFMAQQDQFAATIAEQIATRLQDDVQFKATLASSDARAAVDAGLREKALALQETGMKMEDAFNYAGLAQERELRKSALDLQEQGMSLDDAYRYAAMDQDGTFKREALELQKLGLTLEDAYKQAELGFRQKQLDQSQKQFEAELKFKMDQAKTDDERFKAMLEVWEKYFGNKSGTTGGTTPGGGGTGGGTGGSQLPFPEDPSDPRNFGFPGYEPQDE